MSARRLNSGELPVNVDAEATIATLFAVITPAPAVMNKDMRVITQLYAWQILLTWSISVVESYKIEVGNGI